MYWKKPIILLLIFAGFSTGDDVLRVSGVVLTPGGKPAIDAAVKLVGLDVEDATTTDDSGHFELSVEKSRFKLPRYAKKADEAPWKHAIVVANGDDCGPAWIQVADMQDSESVQLELVDDIPVQGQLVDTEGRPIGGAEVTATGFAEVEGNLDDFFKYSRDRPHRLRAYLSMHMQVVPNHGSLFADGTTTTTTEDGRFEFRGLGKDRVAIVSAKGRNVATDSFYVATVEKIDRKWKRTSNTPSVVRNAAVASLYPSRFHHVALPGRAIAGFVRDKETGKPIKGAKVSGNVGGVGVGNNRSSAETDENGHYEILGLRTEGTLDLSVYTPPSRGYIEARRGPIQFNAAAVPTNTDFELTRGIKVRGRVINAVTKKPIRENVSVSYYTFHENKFVEQLADKIPPDTHAADEDGNFEIIAMPGPGFVGVSVSPVNYRLVSFKDLGLDTDKEGFVSTNEGGLIHAKHDRIAAAHLLDAAEARNEIELNFELNPIGHQMLAIVDRDGKPLSGARIFAGVDPTFAHRYGQAMRDHRMPITVQPEERIALTFHHPKKKLGGFVMLTADVEEVTNVKMRPLGSIQGRLLNRPESDGPFSDVVAAIVQVNEQPSILAMSKLDADGNYLLSDVVAGVDMQIIAGRLNEPKLVGEARLRSGQDLEMRDVDFDNAKEFKRK